MTPTSPNSDTTQRAKVLRLLIDARGHWVPAPELARVGGLQFQTRIYEIRHKLKLKVENRQEHHGGQTHSFYRLVSGPTPASTVAPQPQPEPDPDPVTLFGDLLPTRYPD